MMIALIIIIALMRGIPHDKQFCVVWLLILLTFAFLSVIKMVSNGQVCVGKLTEHEVPLKCLLYKPKHTLKTHTHLHISPSHTFSLTRVKVCNG